MDPITGVKNFKWAIEPLKDHDLLHIVFIDTKDNVGEIDHGLPEGVDLKICPPRVAEEFVIQIIFLAQYAAFIESPAVSVTLQ